MYLSTLEVQPGVILEQEEVEEILARFFRNWAWCWMWISRRCRRVLNKRWSKACTGRVLAKIRVCSMKRHVYAIL